MSPTVTVLLDNRSRDPELASEHGLSLWIEADGVCLLFDTGQSDAFAGNTRRLGVPLERADHIVISHGHYDHAGGLGSALDAAPQAVVHLHPEAMRTRFSIKDPRRPRSVGIPDSVRNVLEAHASRVRWTHGPTMLTPHLGLSGPIPRRTDFEDVGGPFFRDAEGRSPDDLVDDQALWIDGPSGLVAVLGCGHAGVVNTLLHVEQRTKTRRLNAVLGGLHLVAASERRLSITIDALRERRPSLLAPAHCTGETAMERLREAFPQAWRPVFSGARFDL
jgi:7,8-dihydropterin-6-yl-methyl-4-(beta-D-ribofuranosyl)aminobenzene 5'-phosphate synthase